LEQVHRMPVRRRPSARRFARRCVPGAALAAILLWTVPVSASPRSLPDNPRALHYVLQRSCPPEALPVSFEPVDLDGDGFDELATVSVSEMGDHWDLMVSRLTGAGPTPRLSRTFFRPVGLAGAADLDGDGAGEIVLWRQTDRDELRVDVLRASGDPLSALSASIDTLASVPMNDVRGALLPNGIWRGDVELVGAVDRDGDGTREGLVLTVSGGIRGFPRGVRLVDWTDESIVWLVETGATPSGGAVLSDLDGDGSEEIVVGLESPGNMVHAGGWDDRRSYLIALDLDGGLVWERELGGAYVTVAVAAGDVDGDGAPEVVAGMGGRPDGDPDCHGVLVCRGRDGAIAARAFCGVGAGCVAVAKRRGEAGVLVGFDDGVLRRFRFVSGELEEEAAVDCGGAIGALRGIRFDRPSGQSLLLATTREGVIAVLGENLAAVAVLPTGDYGFGGRRPLRSARFETRDGPAESALVGTGQTLYFLRLVRNPVPLGWWAVIGLGVAAVIVAAVPALRRGSLVAARRVLMSRAEREAAIDALMEQLARAGHGKLKATATFRRLRDQLALLSSHDGEPPPGFDGHFRRAVANAREIGIAALRGIAGSAAELGLAGRAAPGLVRDLRSLAKLIDGLADAPPDPSIASALRRQLDGLLPPITAHLERIGYEARLARSCSLGVEVSRVVDSWGDECRRRGIMLDTPDASRHRDTRVLVTSQELTFILDNLIDNAARAVGRRERPRIAISIEADELAALIVRAA
jgi:signal transduction histidine kinase